MGSVAFEALAEREAVAHEMKQRAKALHACVAPVACDQLFELEQEAAADLNDLTPSTQAPTGRRLGKKSSR